MRFCDNANSADVFVMGFDYQSQLKLSQLQVLIAVADYGSFSEAALQLQLSQSAVSYAITTLEEELGISLFSRGRYGAHLTPVGEQIVDRARQMLYLMADIVKQANLAKGLQGGLVRISAFRSARTHILHFAIRRLYLGKGFGNLLCANGKTLFHVDVHPDSIFKNLSWCFVNRAIVVNLLKVSCT